VKLLLFDIDGTLLIGHGAGARAMTRAGKAICGEAFSLDGVVISGGLDPLIFAEAARNMGIAEPAALHDHFRERYLQELQAELVQAARKPEALPGVSVLLDALTGRDDLVLGLLTGNYGRAVPIKLSAVGLRHERFALGAFGDDAESRRGLVPVARGRAPRATPPADTIIIGDTPRDVDCALANGCVCVAVATGIHDAGELKQAGAHRVLDDLRDPGPLLALL